MKIVNFIGGLGNQMFEYAFYLALKDAHPDEVIKCCCRSYIGYGLHNGFELNKIFNIKASEASLLNLCALAYPFINYKTWQFVFHILPVRKTMSFSTSQKEALFSEITRTDSCYYDGTWQNELFFKHIRSQVLSAFQFPPFMNKKNIDLSKKLMKSNSVSIHIRRGDYLNEPEWCVCTQDYYSRAIALIKSSENIDVLCVFSDDIQWCKDNLKDFASDIEYVDWNKGKESFRDMQLMTYCKHNIIANSTFSWWGAWLGNREGKKVIAPKVWCNKSIVNDPICDDWIRI